MNEDNIAALESILGHDDSCWLATLPVPHSYGESNLFAREPVMFRKKKRVAEIEGHTNSYRIAGSCWRMDECQKTSTIVGMGGKSKNNPNPNPNP